MDETQLIAIFIAMACSIVGVFLVLRKSSMMSDSISHSVLIGIVIAFFITRDLSSPYLLVGAALAGLFSVWLTELIIKSRLVSSDSGIGVIFPLLFSLGVILIVKFAGNAHLCTQHIIEGEILFATGHPVYLFGYKIGSTALYTSLAMLILNLVVISVLFKEMKVSTFDPMLAATLGFSPVILHYLLMSLVSITAVGSFQYVGSILVIAFMIGPAATAYLMTDNLRTMLILSCIIATINAILGYQLAFIFDISVAGNMAVITGLSFLLVFLFAPYRGLISSLSRSKRQRVKFAKSTMLFHLHNHAHSESEDEESGVSTVSTHLNWGKEFTQKIVDILESEQKIKIINGIIKLRAKGDEQRKRDFESLVN